jgi:hypothetical protein
VTTNFYVSANEAPSGDLAFQASVGTFTEFDFDNYSGEIISLTAAQTNIAISPQPTIFFGGWGDTGSYGTVTGGALLPPWEAGESMITFSFSPPVRGFGLWVYDDSYVSADAFRMTVTELGGAQFVSPILDSNPGVAEMRVEGFLGASSNVGVTSVTVERIGDVAPFELDHLQIATVTEAPVSVPLGVSPLLGPSLLLVAWFACIRSQVASVRRTANRL